MPDLRHHLARAAAALERARIPQPRLAAEVLLAHLLQRDRAYLYAHPEDELPAPLADRLTALAARRAAGAPLQYLTGVQEFYGRAFAVSPAVLIPRPETELLVEAALARMPAQSSLRVLDVGTGSGCIAVTLALERPAAQLLATDLSPAALAVAAANARRLGAQVEFMESDLLAGVSGRFDLIVSNPPYVSEAEFATLQPEVRDHEPRLALVAGPRGTEHYARLISRAHASMRPGGWLLLELGYASAHAVRALLGQGWSGVETRPDLQGWPRLLAAQRAD
ncbi:MAG: peptide chain release factor N(5)-glutamine methyltransferase [Terriglobales bacterium]